MKTSFTCIKSVHVESLTGVRVTSGSSSPLLLMLLVFHLVFVTREIPTSILIQLFPFCIRGDRINLVIHFSPQITFVRLSTRVILLPGTVEECRCLPFSEPFQHPILVIRLPL